jgi:hypothetical protein
MRRLTVAVSLVVLACVAGWLALQSEGDLRADPKKTRPCGNNVCLVNEWCCAGCFGNTYCAPIRGAYCPPPPPCAPEDVVTPAGDPEEVCDAVHGD